MKLVEIAEKLRATFPQKSMSFDATVWVHYHPVDNSYSIDCFCKGWDAALLKHTDPCDSFESCLAQLVAMQAGPANASEFEITFDEYA